jgi:peptidoglycan-N-acetylglucosamine deacetylase
VRPLVAAAAAVVVLAGLGYLSYREYNHAGALLTPAVITRTMDPARALSPGIGTRIARLVRGPANPAERPKLVALTFDDGPYPVTTPLLLDALRDLDVHATFFLIGRDAQEFPELARRIAASGNEIGNHSLTHPDRFDLLTAPQVRDELLGGARALSAFTSDPGITSMFRPPHGRYALVTVQAAQAAGFDVFLWNDDPGDWRNVPPAEIAAHIEQHATRPDIILLHNGQLATIEILPEIVRRFRAAGYTFVTAGQLLRRAGPAVINDAAKQPI